MIHNLVDAVKGIFFVNEGIEENAEGPDVLFFAAVGLPLKNFRGRVVCNLRLD